MKYFLLCLLISFIVCFHYQRYKKNQTAYNPTIKLFPKIKCIFQIIKGCKKSDKLYKKLKVDIRNKIKNNETNIYKYKIKKTEGLPLCNREYLDLNVYKPIYVIEEPEKGVEVAKMLGLHRNNVTEAILNYQNMFVKTCNKTDEYYQKTSFINFLKILFCASFNMQNKTQDEEIIATTIQNYQNSFSKGQTFNSNYSNIQDSFFFNPNVYARLSQKTEVAPSNEPSIFHFTTQHIYNLKNKMLEGKGIEHLINKVSEHHQKKYKGRTFYEHVKHKITNYRKKRYRKIYKNINGLSLLEHFMEVGKKIPSLFQNKRILKKAKKISTEFHFLKSRFSHHYENLKEDLHDTKNEIMKALESNHTQNIGNSTEHNHYLHNYSFLKFINQAVYHSSVILQKAHHVLNHMNEFLRIRSEKRMIENIMHRRYYDELHFKKTKKYNHIFRWKGFYPTDLNGAPLTNNFYLGHILDYVNAVGYLLSYWFNPILFALKIKNKFYNPDRCCPMPVLLPDKRKGCMKINFVAPPPNSTIFPEGFNPLKPGCIRYEVDPFYWLLKTIQIPMTYYFGEFPKQNPLIANLTGINYLINNATGKQGFLALPPNQIVCVGGGLAWLEILPIFILTAIVALIVFITWLVSNEVYYLEKLKIRSQQRKLYLQDSEKEFAKEEKNKIMLELENEGYDKNSIQHLESMIDPNVIKYIKLKYGK